MTEEDLKERVSWAINYVCDKKGEYRYSNDRLGEEMSVNKSTINSYRLKATAPSVMFCIDFCKKFNKFSYEWLIFGKGEPFPGARAQFPEVCGPEEGVVLEPGPSYGRQGADPLISQIKTLFTDFTKTVSDKLDKIDLVKENQELRSLISSLEKRIEKIEAGARREGGESQGDASVDETSISTEKKAG